jgi:hypothetical protein
VDGINYIGVERPWQGSLCQFFTRDQVARSCLAQIQLPTNLLAIRLLEPAAGEGAFVIPLIRPLVQACRRQRKPLSALSAAIRALEIDPVIYRALKSKCLDELTSCGVNRPQAVRLVTAWIRCADFLEFSSRQKFTHIVGNPPYIRWDAIPVRLREEYRKRFLSFRQRADLYVAFIEHALSLLSGAGQLGFLCPGTWTRNVYGGPIRTALTSRGHLKAIVDFSEADSFERTADAYLEEHDKKSAPTIYLMTYTLLHSYAHYVMQGIQQFSGLDLGSMGEYLFPANLGFVIYRNGMTMDLGDLSALWRNHHEAFLSFLRNYPTSLGCNLGNLCMTKGGACPDCIMIPEVICLTANKYLSRSTLLGRGRPDCITGQAGITGFLQIALEHARRT